MKSKSLNYLVRFFRYADGFVGEMCLAVLVVSVFWVSIYFFVTTPAEMRQKTVASKARSVAEKAREKAEEEYKFDRLLEAIRGAQNEK